MARKTKKNVPSRISHRGHRHPDTPHFKRMCREQIINGGEPLNVVPKKPRRKVIEQQAEVVDAALAATDPEVTPEERAEAVTQVRTSLGRFTRDTLREWDSMVQSIEAAQDYIVDNGVELIEARLTTRLGGQSFIATFDGHQWEVEVQ